MLGIGSELRADDAAGILVAKEVRKYSSRIKGQLKLRSFLGETAPENLTGEIRRFSPTHLLIIDAFDMSETAGATRFFDVFDDSLNISFSTHKLPISILADYIRDSIGCKIGFIGIQPKSVDFAKAPSREIKKSITLVSGAILEAIKNSA